jgi:hypothetical protein
MPYLELEQVEKVARQFRVMLGVDGLAYLDMMTVIVKLKHQGLIKDYRRVPDDEMPEDEAAFDPFERILLIRESTFCAMNRGDPHTRFTIAHELGHIALGHKNTRHRNVSGRVIEKIAPSIKRDEAQANMFAGAFLVPSHLVEAPLEASNEELVARFGLSASAAEVRKPELERIYRRKHGIKRPLPPSITELLRDAKRKGRNVGSLHDDE